MTSRRCIIIGDVVGSRSVADREGLRERLQRGIERTNGHLEDRLVAPFTTLKGVDEVGGVLTDPGAAYRPLREIAEAVHPTAIRFAVVWGRIDIGAASDDVSEMDGPAFHEADQLLADLEDDGRAVALSIPPTKRWLVDLLAGQIHLLFAWKQEWTPNQAEVVWQYRECESMNAVAERRDVSVQAVSQTLGRAKAKTILSIESDLETAMSELWGNLT